MVDQNSAGIDPDDAVDPEDCGFDFSQFSLNDEVDEMEAKMKDDCFILQGIALQGQMTAIYAKHNTGKTLLVMHLLIESAESGKVDGSNVYYINADDHYKGLIEKTKLARDAGFNMLAPGHRDFKTSMLELIIKDRTKKDTCNGVVVVLDTAKKFTDLMNKTSSSEFFEVMRGFVSKGGTVILLAHVNKHRDDNKKVVYAGTSDLVDDADCAYTLDEVAFDSANFTQTVQFENFKSRGNVVLKQAFKYSKAAQDSYVDRLRSVKRLSEADFSQIDELKAAKAKFIANTEAIEAITDVLKSGTMTQSDIIAAVKESAGISRNKVIKALNDHDTNNEDMPYGFQRWSSTTTAKKNKKEYTLLLFDWDNDQKNDGTTE